MIRECFKIQKLHILIFFEFINMIKSILIIFIVIRHTFVIILDYNLKMRIKLGIGCF